MFCCFFLLFWFFGLKNQEQKLSYLSFMIKNVFGLEINFKAINSAGETLHLLQAEQHLGLGPEAGAVRRPEGDRGGRRALRLLPAHPEDAHGVRFGQGGQGGEHLDRLQWKVRCWKGFLS